MTSERAFLRAADLADDDLRVAALLVRAAEMAFWQEAMSRTIEHADRALLAYTAAGDVAGAARAAVFRMLAVFSEGRLAEAIELGRAALGSLGALGPLDTANPVVAELKAVLGVNSYFMGDVEAASDYLDDALALSQRFELPRLLARSMHFSASVLGEQGRLHEARLFYEESLVLTKARTQSDSRRSPRTTSHGSSRSTTCRVQRSTPAPRSKSRVGAVFGRRRPGTPTPSCCRSCRRDDSAKQNCSAARSSPARCVAVVASSPGLASHASRRTSAGPSGRGSCSESARE